MWYKKIQDYSDQISPVTEIRPMLKTHYKSKKRTIGAPVYSMLHFHYVMSLKQITAAIKLPKIPANLRIMESDQKGPIAIHALSTDNYKPELFKTFVGQKFILDFQKAISKIKIKEQDEAKGEIRSLSVPALNVEAIWLHHKGGKGDVFSLVWKLNPDDKDLLTSNEFLAYLNKKKQKLGNMTDEMGA